MRAFIEELEDFAVCRSRNVFPRGASIATPDVPEECWAMVSEAIHFPEAGSLSPGLISWNCFTADAGVQGFRRALHGAADGLLRARRNAALTVLVATSGDTGTPSHTVSAGTGEFGVVILIRQAISEAQKSNHHASENIMRWKWRAV